VTTKGGVRRHFASATDKKCCSGVDEAGLGPILGPLAVVRVSVAADNPEAINDLFKNSNSGIGDSKRVHTNWDLAPIESIALGGLAWVTGGKVPSTASELFSLLGEKPEERNLPWMAGAEDLKLPITTSEVTKWNVPGVEPVGFDGVIVHPSTLNTLRRNGINKANLEVQYIGKIMSSLPETYKEHYVDIDRLGGRVYYGDILQQFWNNATVEVVEEVRNRSAYTAHSADTGTKRFVQFLVGGEDQSALIALSSCISKYTREVHMLLFNTYWQNKFPGLLKSTTGYFTDATIWIRRVNKLDPTVLPPIMEDLIRAGSSKKFSPW
jgi:ribonuclease HII